MNKIKMGWSESDLTPQGRTVELAGQFYERISDQVETPICVTALAIECGGESAVFCSCDLAATSTHLLAEVRKRVDGKDGFPTDKLMLNAIHTHTSLGYAGRSDGAGSSLSVLKRLMPPERQYKPLVKSEDPKLLNGEEALFYLADKIADAALDAWNKRSDAMYAQGFGRAAVGLCRRVCYDDGSAKMWGDTNMANFTELEGGNDSGIELLFTYDASKKLTGVIANVACPAQVLEHRNFISSDYMGKVKEKLRKKLGDDIYFLGLVSPAGDQCPRDLVRWVEPETPINDPNIERPDVIERVADPSMFDIKGCDRAARRIADEILYALEDVCEYKEDSVLKHKVISLDMPLRRVTIEEKDKAEEAIKRFINETEGEFTYVDNAKMHVHAGTIARYEIQQKMDVKNIEVHIIRLGNIAFATNPYELFLDYGNQIRARSRASQTFLIQLCCGSCGYLPTQKAEKGSHYSAYVSSGTSGHIGGDLLVRKTVSEINAMLAE
ncbi:MAG: hypothetical protein J6B23_02335 [Clostridia bacterium]|nr:hypothetical protein [Clostridia bacterium]